MASSLLLAPLRSRAASTPWGRPRFAPRVTAPISRRSHSAAVRGVPSLIRASYDPNSGREIKQRLEGAAKEVDGAMREATGAAMNAAESVAGGVEKAANTLAGRNPRGAAVYGTLAALYGVLALAKIAAPEACIELVYNACGKESALAFMRLAGVFMLLPAMALWCLKGAAEHGRLSSSTYERLNLSLVIGGFGYAGLATALAMSSGFMLTPSNYIWGVVGVGAVTAIMALHVLARGAGPGSVLSRIPSEAVQVFQPKNKIAAFYSLLTVVSFAMGAALLAAPTALHGFLFSDASSLGALNIALKRQIGIPILTAGAAATFTLKDGADRNRLGSSTFKLLNLAFGLACAGTLAILGQYVQYYSGAQLTAVSGSMFAVLAAAAGTCLYQWLTAKK